LHYLEKQIGEIQLGAVCYCTLYRYAW